MTARKPAQKSFCFAYLLVSVVVTLSSLTATPRRAALEMRRFLLKNRRLDGKRALKSTSAGNHRGSLLFVLVEKVNRNPLPLEQISQLESKRKHTKSLQMDT